MGPGGSMLDFARQACQRGLRLVEEVARALHVHTARVTAPSLGDQPVDVRGLLGGLDSQGFEILRSLRGAHFARAGEYFERIGDLARSRAPRPHSLRAAAQGCARISRFK